MKINKEMIKKINRKYFLILLLLTNSLLFSFDNSLESIWPIQGAEKGSNIILSPDNKVINPFTNTEERFTHYVLGAKEGTPVVAIADSQIFFSSYGYSLNSYELTSIGNYEDVKKDFENKFEGRNKWINFSLGLQISPGHIIWYGGLLAPSEKSFEIGQSVKKGDVIGFVGYSYMTIEEPGIAISYSIDSKVADIGPMLLGVNNNLFEKRINKPNYRTYKHSILQMKQALRIVKDSLVEGHPTLYRYTTKIKFDDLYNSILSQIKSPLTSDEFYTIISPLIQIIKNQHTYLTPQYKYDSQFNYSPHAEIPVRLTVVDNKCYLLSDKTHNTKRGTEVLEIDNESISDLIIRYKKYMYVADGFNESSYKENLIYNFNKYLIADKKFDINETFKLTFKNNIVKDYSTFEFKKNNQSSVYESTISIEEYDNDTVSLKIKEMYFSDYDRDKIKEVLSNRKYKNVILDLRFNPGGNNSDSDFIYSFFTQNSFYPEIERMVNKNDTYDFFKYTDNFVIGKKPFENYRQIEGRKGFYLTPETSCHSFNKIIPFLDNKINRDVYVLINSYTGSAAVSLASYFKRFNTGTIIGTETGGAYHQQTALHHAKITLGELGIILNIPLIETVVDKEVSSDKPFGRGVIPDYIIERSIDDIVEGNDSVMSFAQKLIKEKEL